MQTWDQLFTGFTNLSPAIRYPVLREIGNPNRRIIEGYWQLQVVGTGDEDDCLFKVAATAATRNKIGQVNYPNVAVALGMNEQEVREGVKLWDNGTSQQRELFRARVREFVEREYPVIEFGPESEQHSRPDLGGSPGEAGPTMPKLLVNTGLGQAMMSKKNSADSNPCQQARHQQLARRLLGVTAILAAVVLAK